MKQPPSRRIDLRHLAVAAHVERVRGGHRRLGQGGGAGLGVERIVLVHDQVGTLAVGSHGGQPSPDEGYFGWNL